MWLFRRTWKGPSGFSYSSTAEEVTEGIDGSGLTAIVTGASCGIGMETSRILALRGVHVIMGIRNLSTGTDVKESILKETPNAKVDIVELDLSSMASVRKFVADFNSLGLPLNILINNAGVLMLPFTLSKDAIELHFATNHIGHFLLTDLLLENMKTTAQKSGTEGWIVNISSDGYLYTYREGIWFDEINDKEGYNGFCAYGQSKLANIFHAQELAIRLKAVKLMDEVEEVFIKHFGEDDKRKAMKYLKPQQCKESHGITFFIGLFTGCFFALFVGYCIMAHIAGMYTGQSDSIYMETVYPILSIFTLLFLHLFLYGCNIFMWRKARINYSFIFEFAPTKELKYRDVFLISTTSMSIVVGVIFAHLSLTAKGYSYTQLQVIPGVLLLMFLLLLVCPFNIIYRSSRYHFLRVIRNIVLAPLYKVVMVDFFMADQLCSQVPMLRSLEYVACYYITSSYRTQDYGFCMRTPHYRDLSYAVSFLPYYWRAMQCVRRWFDEGDTSHLINLGKYVSTMLAAGAKVAYEKEKNIGWLSLVVVVSSMATMYQLYWDFVKDWGLLQFNSKNPWLRNELILRRKFIYFLSMGLNFILRLAWLQTVLHYNFGSLDYRVTSFFLAPLKLFAVGNRISIGWKMSI